MLTFLSPNCRKQARAHTHTHKKDTEEWSVPSWAWWAFLEKICDKIFSKEYTNTDIKFIILVSKTTKNKIREKYNQEIFPQVFIQTTMTTEDERPLTSELLAQGRYLWSQKPGLPAITKVLQSRSIRHQCTADQSDLRIDSIHMCPEDLCRRKQSKGQLQSSF